MDAEFLAWKGKHKEAIECYEKAILVAARGGYPNDAVLATKRWGEFYLNVIKDREGAMYHLGQSKGYWKQWGAKAKVDHLERKYSFVVVQPTEVFTVHARGGQ